MGNILQSRRIGSRRLTMHFACNDERGHFAGQIEGCSIDIGGETLELDGWARFTVDSAGMRFLVHRVWFPFVAEREWVCNWCWNAYSMKRPQAVRLLQHLAHSGRWTCNSGPLRVVRWFESMAPQETTCG